MWCDGNMMGWTWVGGLFWLLLAAAVVLFFVRDWFPGARQRATQPPGDDQALDLLRRRFASGDIDEREYRERLEILRQNGNG